MQNNPRKALGAFNAAHKSFCTPLGHIAGVTNVKDAG